MVEERNSTAALGQQLSRNLVSVLRVAGSQRVDGRAGRMAAVAVQKQSGIARSTLRALTTPSRGHEPNPDLRTLARLSDALGIPAAFLLMRPDDWTMLYSAFNGLSMPLNAVQKVASRQKEKKSAGDLAELVLRECGVHPEAAPIDVPVDAAELDRLQRRNERRRRNCQTISALMLQGRRPSDLPLDTVALAAAIANQSTPVDPDQRQVDVHVKKAS